MINNVNKIKKSWDTLLNVRINKSRYFTTSKSQPNILENIDNNNNQDFEQVLKNTKIRIPTSALLLPTKPKVCIGMSGGVDSTITAKLLKLQGFDVTGVFIKSWDEVEDTGRCQGERDWKDALEASEFLDIPMFKADFVKDYWNRVFIDFLKGYENGLTPNPDVWCNREIKFDLFFDFAKENFGVDYIATGHYSNLYYGEGENNSDNLQLHRAVDKNKDQTFFLCMTKGERLKQALFPIGGFTKEKIVSFAKTIPDFSKITSKKSSRGICFIGKRPLPDFLSQYIPLKPGEFFDISTNQFIKNRQHKGAICYTIGQKPHIDSLSEKYFVVRSDIKSNIVYVCPESQFDNYSKHYNFKVYSFNWINEIPIEIKSEQGFKARGICRHRGEVVDLTIKDTGKISSVDGSILYSINLDQPLRSVVSGQILCLFDRITDRCYGGGVIDSPPLYNPPNK
ncbi:hypothetical protein RB653_008748 [Dictyostelium firmibasis]|uniref:tRNA-5-taurinomethyluridine 2-sulfurtransferase n=1 Tax=Dictyostelium firmibasis TaxID=79012 RepID=A0AAN7TT20_9MYCE